MESVALYSFQATEKDELPFQKGDTLKVQGTGVTDRGGFGCCSLGARRGHTVTPGLSLSLTLTLLALSGGFEEQTSRVLERGAAFPARLCLNLREGHPQLGHGLWPPWLPVPPAVPRGSPPGLGHLFPAPWGTGGHRDPAAESRCPNTQPGIGVSS